MTVHKAMGLGIGAGAFIVAIALGYIPVAPEHQVEAYRCAWWIVVLTTLLPFASYLQGKLALKGPWGGFIGSLGTGLGCFLLATGKIS